LAIDSGAVLQCYVNYALNDFSFECTRIALLLIPPSGLRPSSFKGRAHQWQQQTTTTTHNKRERRTTNDDRRTTTDDHYHDDHHDHHHDNQHNHAVGERNGRGWNLEEKYRSRRVYCAVDHHAWPSYL